MELFTARRRDATTPMAAPPEDFPTEFKNVVPTPTRTAALRNPPPPPSAGATAGATALRMYVGGEESKAHDDDGPMHSPNRSPRSRRAQQRSSPRDSPRRAAWSPRVALSPQARESLSSLAESTSSPTAYRLAAVSTLSKDGAISDAEKAKLKDRIIGVACPKTDKEAALGEGLDHAFRVVAREGTSEAVNDALADADDNRRSKAGVPRVLRYPSASELPAFGSARDLQDFLCRPMPRHMGMLRLRVFCAHERKGPFYCYDEASGKILMEARIQRSFMKKHYRVWMHVADRHIDEIGQTDDGANMGSLGALKSAGVSYLLHGDGEKVGRAAGVMKAREEHGLFVYDKKLARAPRALTAVLPNVDYRNENRTACRPMRTAETVEAIWAGGKCKAALLNNRSGQGRLLTFKQRQPTYDKVRGRYSLDFKGRCRYPSEKNFMLNDPFDELQTVVLMGSMAEGGDEFALDVCFPCSVFQAFGMALSQLDSASWSDIR